MRVRAAARTPFRRTFAAALQVFSGSGIPFPPDQTGRFFAASRHSATIARTRRHSAKASCVCIPCRYRPFWLPLGAPLPAAPPCIRHRAFPPTAGDWHTVPARVWAQHLLAERNCEGSRFDRCMGLISVFEAPPSP